MNITTNDAVRLGLELVVIGGVTYWLNGKINRLETNMTQFVQAINTVKELKEIVQRQNDVIEQQRALIMRHEAMLSTLMGGAPPPRPQAKSAKVAQRPSGKVPPAKVAKDAKAAAVRTPPPEVSSPKREIPGTPTVTKEDIVEIVANDVLDQLLQAELESLKRAESTSKVEELPDDYQENSAVTTLKSESNGAEAPTQDQKKNGSPN